MVWSVRNDHPTPIMDTIDTTTAMDPLMPPRPVSAAAHTRAGKVMTSPVAVTSGATTLSRSTEADRTARHDEGDPEHAKAIAPPTALTVMKSMVDIVGETLNTIATPFARRASSTETTRLRISAAAVF